MTQISDEQTCARTGCFLQLRIIQERKIMASKDNFTFRITTRKPLGSNCWRRGMDGPPKLVVSGKNWTVAARAPGKLLLKLIFPCAHCRADGRILSETANIWRSIHAPSSTFRSKWFARCDPKRWSCPSMPWSTSLVFLAWEKILSVHKFVRPKLAASDFWCLTECSDARERNVQTQNWCRSVCYLSFRSMVLAYD